MLHRIISLTLLTLAMAPSPAYAHPGGHGTEEAFPPPINTSVPDPATAWRRLQQHRDKLAESVSAGNWETAARLGGELRTVAGDLVQASRDLPPDTYTAIVSAAQDLSATGRQIANAATAKKAPRAFQLLEQVNFQLNVIAEKYPKGVLNP